MAFNVTYGSLLSRNIKHLYTTREKTMHNKIPRQKFYRPEFLELEMQAKERHQKRRRTRRRQPNMEFVPEFDIDIPRAPAFRVADKEYVDEVVNRLHRRSRVKSNPRGCDHYQRGYREYEWEEDEIETPRDHSMTRREVKAIVDRLTKPTYCGKRHPSPVLREDDYLPNITI